jgi:uncharacterized protein YqhQ
MHKDRKRRVQQEGRNTGGKAVVMGMLQRGGKVVASVVPDPRGSPKSGHRGSLQNRP